MHPIDTTHVQAAYEAEAECRHSVRLLESTLDRIQSHFATDLDTLLQAHFEAGHPYHEAPAAFYCDAETADVWGQSHPTEKGVFSALDITDHALQRAVLRAHRNQYVTDAETAMFTEAPMPTPPETPFVVAKPPAWIAAERHDGWELTWLIETADCSCAEAFDFYKTRVQRFSPQQWATKRGRDAETIRKNARQAARKIAATTDSPLEAQDD